MRFLKSLMFVFLVAIVFVFGVSCSESKEAVSDSFVSPEIGEVVIDTSRKIIYKVTLHIETSDINESVKKYNSKIIELEGYVNSSTVSLQEGHIVYKIPSEKLNDFLSFTTNDDEIVEKTITSNDVTSQYNQITARLEVLEASRAAYLVALEEAKTWSQIIEINDKIAEIDTEIQTLEYEKASYDKIVDYSTITIYFNSFEKEEGFFAKYWNYVVTFFTGLGKFILYALPIALVGGIIIAIIIFVEKVNKRKKNKSDLK